MNGIQTWPIRRFLLLFSCVLFLCSVFFCGKALAFSVTEKSGYVEATTGVNVRSGPGKEYNTLGSLKEGEQIPMTGLTDNGWYEIKFKGQAGYVYSSYVTEIEDSSSTDAEEAKETRAEETSASGVADSGNEEEGVVPSLTIPVLNVTIPGLTRTLLFVLAGIVIVVIIILSTIVSFRKGGDDEEDEEEEQDEEDEEETEKDEDRVLEVYRPTRRRSSSTEELSREELEAALTAANQKIASLQREIEYLKRTRR